MKKFFLSVFIISLIVGYAFYTRSRLQSSLGGSEDILKSLPVVTFTNLQAQPVSVYDLASQNKINVVHFWATWCGPCEAELPELVQAAQAFTEAEKVGFFIVAVNDQPSKVENFIKKITKENIGNVHWLLDQNNTHQNAFGTFKLPETFIFDSQRKLLRHYVGPQKWNKEVFLQHFSQILTEKIPTH
jgi:cytochrome c biogenesis protein CcmG, thiol:disulfide interchange protein DsbE